MSTFNHCYRLKWSPRAQSLQPVPETAHCAGKSAPAGQSRANSGSRVSGVLAVVALATISTLTHAQQAPPAANQLPTGGAVVRGNATISQTTTANAASMVVNQGSNRAVINWNSFNLGSNAQVNFNQPGSSAVTLNQVLSNDPSQIYGRITANGQVFFSNPSGMYFSPTASVDVGGLVATTHTINADAFMAGQSTFQRNGATGSVINEGTLQASLGGYIALLAPEVRNAGLVVANAGTVALASGEAITLNFQGSNTLAGITTTASTIAALVENRQAVVAEGGQIILSANALSGLQGSVVKNSGSLRATSLTSKGGKIVLEGDSVALSGSSQISADGATGGGTVLVGGDWQGSSDMRQATTVSLAQGARITANATQAGDGGKVVLWSDVRNAASLTQVEGSIEAKAAGSGNGGQVETSGHTLAVGDQATVSTQAAGPGTAGQWLLDPADISIVGPTTAEIGYTAIGGDFSPNSGVASSKIKATTIATALASGDVTVSTANSGVSGGAAGNISFSGSAISWSTASKLTLFASGVISNDGSGTITMTGGGTLVFNQAGDSGATNYAGQINGNGNFVKDGAGTLYIGLGGITGSVTINAGVLKFGNSPTFNASTSSAITVNAGGAIDLYGRSAFNSVATTRLLTLNGSGVLVNGVYSGALFNSAASAATYGGPVALGSDTLINSGAVANASINITGNISTAGYRLTLGGSATSNLIGGTIDGTGALIKQDAGTWTLNGASTFTGGLSINGGTLNAGVATSALGASTNAVTVNGGTLALGANSQTVGNVTVGANGGAITGTTAATVLTASGIAINNNGSTTATISASLDGSAALTKTDTGTAILSGTNSYSGGTTVSGGVLQANSATAFGTGAIAIDSGATLAYNTAIAPGAYVSNTFTGSGSATIANVYRNSILHLENANLTGFSGTYAASLDETLGAVSANSCSVINLGASPNLSNSTFNVLTKGYVASFSSYPEVTWTGTATGTPTLKLNGTTVSSGAIALGGTLTLNPLNMSISSGAAWSLTNNGTTTYLGATDVTGATLVGNATATIYSGASVTESGLFSGSGNLVLAGSGTLTLSGANSYTGSTSITGGTLKLGNSSALGSGSGGVSVSTGAALDLGGQTLSTTKMLTLSGTGISGGGALMNSGAAATYAGPVTLGADSAVVGGTGSIALSNLGAITGTSFGLTLGGAQGGSIASSIDTGSGTLTKQGAGTWTLSGANSYSGGTTVSAGILKAGSATALGSGTVYVGSGAALDLNGQTMTSLGGLTLNGTGISNGGALMNSSASAASFAGLLTLGTSSAILGGAGSIALTNLGSITGATLGLTLGGAHGGSIASSIDTTTGTLTKQDAGTWTLSGLNTYSGVSNISAGVLKAGSAMAFGAGTVNITAAGAGIAAVDLNGQTLTSTGSMTLRGTGISGGGALMNSSATGATFAGVLTLGAASSIIGGTGTITLSSTGTLSGTYALTLGGAQGGSIASIIGTSTGTLTKQDAGTWTLSGASTYSGGTTISAGTLKAGNATAFGTGAMTVNSGAALDLNGQTMSSTGGLTLSGTGISNGGALMNSSATAARYAGLVTLGAASSIIGDSGSIALTSTGVAGITGTYALTLGGAQGGSIATSINTSTGTLTKQDTGSWALSGTNTYTGGTTINGGTLTIFQDSGLGAVPGTASTNVTLNGGTLGLNNTSGLLSLNANRSVLIGSSGGSIAYTSALYALNLGNSITGTGAFTLNAPGNTGTATLSGVVNLSGAVSLYGGDLTLAGNISSNGRAILVKSSGNILQNASVAVNSGGGAVTYWADSDASGAGNITLNAGTASSLTSINSAGGAITLGGGAGSSAPSGASIGVTGVNLAAYSQLQAGSGAIVVTGQSNRAGSGGSGLSIGSGAVVNGASIALTGYGSANASGSAGMNLGAAQIVASDWVTLTGTGGAGGAGDGVVLNASTVGSSGNGTVTVLGTGGSGSGANRGIVINGNSGGGHSTLYSSSGTLQLTGTGGGGGLAGGSYGIASSYANTIGAAGQGATTLNANGWNWDTTGITSFLGNGPVTLAPLAGSSVLGDVGGALYFGSTITGLTIGTEGNTGSVTLSQNNSVAGPISIYGSAINLFGTLTSTGSGAHNLVTLKGSSNITDTGLLTASGLLLQGSGNTTTSVNGAIGTVAGSGLGNVVITTPGALAVGSLGGVQGISASGTVSVSTASGDLTLNNSVTTSNASATAMVLDAGTSMAALTSTGGNIVVGTGATVSVGNGGRATLYTGSVADSTGLGALVGIGSGHFRYASNLTTTGYNIGSAGLGAGLYAIFREQPLVTWGNAANQTITYGQRPVIDTTTAVSGFVNGDTASQSFSILNQSTGLGTALNASGFYNAGNYVLSKTAAAQTLGYAANNPTLTVRQATLTITAADASKTYNAAPYSGGAGVIYSGFVTGESVAQLGGAISYGGTSQGAVNAGSYSVTPGGRTSNNYSFNYVSGTLTINQAPLTVQVNSDARFVTQGDTALYNGVSYAGFVGGQNASILGGTLAIARSGGDTLPGSYTGVLLGSGLTSNNYQISYRPGNYTIIPANQLWVKVSNTQDTYGGAPAYAVTSAQYLNSNNTIIDLSGNVTLNGNSLSLSDGAGGNTAFTLGPKSAVLSGAGLTAVGAYQLGASSISSTSGNYSNNLVVTGALQVNPKPVTATLGTGPVKTYDGTNALSSAALDFTGLVQGDTATISGSAAYSTANAGNNIGYTVANLALSGHDAGNYVLSAGNTISANNGTINLAPLTIRASNDVKTYDALAYSGGNGVTYSGLVNNQDASVLTGTLGYAGSAQGAINAGNYSITPQGLSSGNYAITYVDGNLAVTPAPVSITAINGSLTGTVSKVYDGTTTAYLTGSNFLLSGWLGSDGAVVTSAFGSYDNANAGTGKMVSVALSNSNYAASGVTNLANYLLPTSLSGAVGTVTQAPLTVTGTTVASKTYDGTTVATLSAGTLQGLVGTDSFTLMQSGSFISQHVNLVNGSAAPVVVTTNDSVTPQGNTLAGNYTLVQPTGLSAVIAQAPLTVSGTAATGKTYDGTTTASVGSGLLQGVLGNDVVTLTQSGNFVSAHVNLVNGLAAPVAVTVNDSISAQGNTQASDYSLVQPTGLSAVITQAPLTVSGSTVASKTYDTTTTAHVGSGALQGVLGNDAFTLTESGSFVSPHVHLVGGSAAPVAVTASDSITAQGSTQASDYRLVQPTGLSAIITPAALTVTASTVADKIYDGGSTASVGSGALQGVLGNDAFTLTQSGSFVSPHVNVVNGNAAPVAVSASDSIAAQGSTQAGDYAFVQPTGLSAVIRPASLSVALTNSGVTKVYDGSTSAPAGFAPALAVTGLVAGDSVARLTMANATYNSANVAAANSVSVNGLAVQYVTGSLGSLVSDYTLANTTATTSSNVSITPAPLTMAANDSAKFITQADPFGYAGVRYSGFVNNENSSVLNTSSLQFVRSDASNNNAGTYTLGASGVSANHGNYSITTQPGSFSILGASQLLLQIAPTTETYGSGAGAYAVSSAQYLNGANVIVSIPANQISVSNGVATVSDGVGGVAVVALAPRNGSYSSSGNLNAGTYEIGAGSVTASNVQNFSNTVNVLGVETVTAAQVTPSASRVSKVYDGTTAMTGLSMTLTGVQTHDQVAVNGFGNFSDANAGAGKSFTLSGLTLSGADAGNYYLGNAAAFSGNNGQITPAPLTVTGTTVAAKTYDGTTAATLSAGVLQGLVGSDNFTLTQSGSFVSSHVNLVNGSAAQVEVTANDSITPVGNTLASNYTLTQPAGLAAVIAQAPLTISAVAASKTYDGQTSAIGAVPQVGALAGAGEGNRLASALAETYSDANVGTGKTLTVSPVTVLDANGNDITSNYQIRYVPSNNGSINQLSSVAWVGGYTGNWFNPANWAGGAVPDLANVANVVVPAGVTVTFSAAGAPAALAADAAQPVVLYSLGNAGMLAMTDGSLQVGTGGMTLAGLSQSGGTIRSAGTVQLSGFAQTGGTLTAAADFTNNGNYSQTANGTVSVAGDTTVRATAPVVLGPLSVGGNLWVQTPNAEITQVAAITVNGSSTLDVGNAAVQLTQANNRLRGPVTVHAGQSNVVGGPAAPIAPIAPPAPVVVNPPAVVSAGASASTAEATQAKAGSTPAKASEQTTTDKASEIADDYVLKVARLPSNVQSGLIDVALNSAVMAVEVALPTAWPQKLQDFGSAAELTGLGGEALPEGIVYSPDTNAVSITDASGLKFPVILVLRQGKVRSVVQITRNKNTSS